MIEHSPDVPQSSEPLVCANRDDCKDGFCVHEVEAVLFGLRLTIPLCDACSAWFAKFYREARLASQHGK